MTNELEIKYIAPNIIQDATSGIFFSLADNKEVVKVARTIDEKIKEVGIGNLKVRKSELALIKGFSNCAGGCAYSRREFLMSLKNKHKSCVSFHCLDDEKLNETFTEDFSKYIDILSQLPKVPCISYDKWLQYDLEHVYYATTTEDTDKFLRLIGLESRLNNINNLAEKYEKEAAIVIDIEKTKEKLKSEIASVKSGLSEYHASIEIIEAKYKQNEYLPVGRIILRATSQNNENSRREEFREKIIIALKDHASGPRLSKFMPITFQQRKIVEQYASELRGIGLSPNGFYQCCYFD